MWIVTVSKGKSLNQPASLSAHRNTGSVEVSGSIPLGSIKKQISRS